MRLRRWPSPQPQFLLNRVQRILLIENLVGHIFR
jgi:hypothetical protein